MQLSWVYFLHLCQHRCNYSRRLSAHKQEPMSFDNMDGQIVSRIGTFLSRNETQIGLLICNVLHKDHIMSQKKWTTFKQQWQWWGWQNKSWHTWTEWLSVISVYSYISVRNCMKKLCIIKKFEKCGVCTWYKKMNGHCSSSNNPYHLPILVAPDLTNSLLIPVGMYVYSITCPLILTISPATILNLPTN